MKLDNLIILPVLLPLAGAILTFMLKGRLSRQKLVALVVLGLNLAWSLLLLAQIRSGEILAFSAGDWPVPFGIVFACDIFSALMLTVSAIVSLAVLLYAFHSIDIERGKFNFYAFFLLLVMGVNGAFLTGDIFNLYVFFEIMLISSYVLMSLGGEKAQLRETFKYMVINMLASALFLIGVALLYAVTGTLNMADLAVKIRTAADHGLLTVIAMIFMVVFGTKAAIFPLYFWLPQSYPATPPAVNAVLGGLLTKVGVYCLFRAFTLLFTFDPGYTHTILRFIAGATMAAGIIGAVGQFGMRSLLSYHIVSQIGYMIMGLGIFTPLGIAAGIYHLVHNMIVKTALFLTAGVTHDLTGTTDLHKLGGLLKVYPLLGWTFFFAGISLAGAPPMSGFFSKFALILAGLDAKHYLLVTVAVLISLLTLYSMMKIFRYAFWGQASREYPKVKYGPALCSAVALVAISLAMGLGADWMLELVMAAGEQMMDPDLYIRAVLLEV